MAPPNNNTFGTSSNGSATTNTVPSVKYNPALLLNPKGFSPAAAAQKAQSRTSTTPTPSLDSPSFEFQFSTPSDVFEIADSPVTSHHGSGADTPQGNGFGDMIERMNNVQKRTAAPQSKRRKLETEGDSPSANGFRGGGSGVIGQYVKEKRDQAAQQSSARGVETVDLTDGNGEIEVIEIKESKDEEICYGMIQGARLNCHTVPRPKPGQFSLNSAYYWPIVKIMLKRNRGEPSLTINAMDYTRNIVGTVDATTSSGLAALLDSDLLNLRTDCRLPTRKKEPGEQAGEPTSMSYSLDLMIYGPRKKAKAVGRHLSHKNIWLRNPPRVDAGIKFENPQALDMPQPPSIMKDRNTISTSSMPTVMRTVEEIRFEVMGVFDSLTKSEDLPEMEPGPLVVTELLKHQKQGLHFMTNKEKPRQLSMNGKAADSFWQMRIGNNGQRIYHNVITGQAQREPPPETFGGILADMMGLGKTLSILSLIATSMDEAVEWSTRVPVQPQAPPPPKTPRSFNAPAPTPLALTHLTHNGKATLLVCPLSTITNWEEQIKAHIKPGGFTYHIYHGSNRIKDAKKLAEFDLVITTYGSVASEVTARHKGRAGSYPLEEVGWFRVVLDEAHMIREQSTLQFKAICRLQANRRWAVTGTPVQNKLDDLAALLAFLRLKPFDEKGKFTQFIVSPFKVCDPEIVPKLRVLVDSITLRRLKDRINLPPRTDQLVRLDFSPAELKLYQLFEQNANDKVQVLAGGQERMIGGKVYIHILQSILRLRLIAAHGRELLSEADLELVQGMSADSAIDLDSDDDDDRPALAEARAYDAFALMQETGNDNCHLCQRKIGGSDAAEVENEREEDIMGYITACFHLLCTRCVSAWDDEVGNRGHGTCPICQQHVRLQYNELRKSKAEVEHGNGSRGSKSSKSTSDAKVKTMSTYTGPHTKTRALVDDLLKTKALSEASPDEPPFKSVVFSGWTTHIDLLQIALDGAGIRYTRLDGSMSRLARTAAMDAFRDDPDVHVILVSIMAGGLGLNLTAGNHVYVMEPQYNPAAEAQAVDRVHRLGQKRPVRTVRYIMRNSIEEKMLELQEKKMKLASLSMDRSRVMDKSEAAKQKLMDLRSLFK
ncbi:SNF2 family domain-containing protein [Microdochium trichocladiopsis]|uniref:SNF2 family domain-containing protein n=1 Tax=Microdochium trichocladiopsis TaxID=1682393 RepID=A0A9P8Y6P9_9PEZI|nr:SNF2 family domain-containing protein [Microdochium trichocladiopsis]KAH7030928.1 SNF2 family domain-containing protein [Microdochium trichocladiopsis]